MKTKITGDPLDNNYTATLDKTVLGPLELTLQIETVNAINMNILNFRHDGQYVGNINVKENAGTIFFIDQQHPAATFRGAAESYNVFSNDGGAEMVHPVDYFIWQYAVRQLGKATDATRKAGIAAMRALQKRATKDDYTNLR